MSFSRQTLVARKFCLFLLLVFSLPSAHAQKAATKAREQYGNGFHWITQNSDPLFWKQIQNSFREELKADEPSTGKDELDIYTQKTIEKVGVLGHAAFVIVNHRPSQQLFRKNSWDEYSTAYNFDANSRQHSTIPSAEWMWQWKPMRLAKFGPSQIPDLVFTFFDCTECEANQVLSSLRYDAKTENWEVRFWGDGKDPWWATESGVSVYVNVKDGGDLNSFDCAYGILDLDGNGFDDVAVRCKEVRDEDSGKTQIDDTTLLYSLVNGGFRRRRITDASEVVELMAKVCKIDSSSLLCKLPAYMTVTSGQNHFLAQMFPNAPKTSRELKDFLGLKRGMMMEEVASICGEPDEMGGSGISIFIYHLQHGSLVAIWAAGAGSKIGLVTHIDETGKATEIRLGE